MRDGVKTGVKVLLAIAIGAAAIAYSRHLDHKVESIRSGPAFDARAVEWGTHRSKRQLGYKVKYQFTLEGVTYTSDWATVPRAVHDATRAGAPLPVRRAATRPEWHLPEASIAGVQEDAEWALLAGVAAIFVGSAAVIIPWVARRRRARAATAAFIAQHAKPPADNFPKDPPPAAT
jgi:hypothetical protein